MKRHYLLLLLLFTTGLFSGVAQTISSQKGLTTAIFNLPAGTIRVHLPDDIRPGDNISGSISAEPAGKNVKQMDKNLAALKKYTVDFDGQKFPVSDLTNPVQYKISYNKLLQRPLSLVSSDGINAGQVSIECAYSPGATKPPGGDCQVPSHALTAAPLRITGPFDGNSSNTNCTVGGQPAAVLAESFRQCILSFPADLKGIQTLNVQEKGNQLCSKNVSPVNMNVDAGKLNLLRGERTYVDVKISGLQGLTGSALLTINNVTTDIVSMQPANNVVITLNPDSVGDGNFSRHFNIQSINNGAFTVHVNLDLPEPPKDLYTDIPKTTNNDNKTDTVPCKEPEEKVKAAEEALEKLKTELAGIDNLISSTQRSLDDCNKVLNNLLHDYWAKKKVFDDRDNNRKNWEKSGKSLNKDNQEKLDDAKKEKDAAAKEWSEQDKKCKALEAELAALKARKAALPGLIATGEGELKGAKDELEKCKTKAADDKKRKEDEERRKTEAEPGSAGGNANPGTGAGKEGSPCNPEGATLVENKRIYGDCYAADVSLQPCNMSQFDNDIMNALKKILEKIKPLAKPLEIAEKVAECSSTAKAVCVNFHIKRDWEDVELKYECINGKWVLMNRRSVKKGTDDYGNFTVNDPETGVCCWIFGKKEDGEKVLESHLATAIENVLIAKGCK